jgi:hypothetical protein
VRVAEHHDPSFSMFTGAFLVYTNLDNVY